MRTDRTGHSSQHSPVAHRQPHGKPLAKTKLPLPARSRGGLEVDHRMPLRGLRPSILLSCALAICCHTTCASCCMVHTSPANLAVIEGHHALGEHACNVPAADQRAFLQASVHVRLPLATYRCFLLCMSSWRSRQAHISAFSPPRASSFHTLGCGPVF